MVCQSRPGSTVGLSQYLVSDVARIEVVKGASSAQYGSSAMGGVVNVITRPIEQGFGGSATVDVGNYGSQNDNGRNTSANNRHGRFNLGGGGETWRLALSGDSMDGDGFGLDPQKWARQGDASKRQQLTARAQWLPRKEGNFWWSWGTTPKTMSSGMNTSCRPNMYRNARPKTSPVTV